LKPSSGFDLKGLHI